MTYDLWFQVGMVGAFMAFTLALLKAVRGFIEKRNEQYTDERKERDVEWRTWLANRDAVFMDFLAAERSHRSDSMDVGMEELNKVTAAVRDLATAMAEHDNHAGERHTEILLRLSRIPLGGDT